MVASFIFFRDYTNWLVLFALGTGILKKLGKPEFKKEFARKCIFVEDTQILGYMAVASMSGGNGMVIYAPVLAHGLLTCS